MTSKSGFWIISKRKIHDCFEEVSRHKTFHEAMEELKKVDGDWSAFWTLNQIFKGDHTLAYFVLPDESEPDDGGS